MEEPDGASGRVETENGRNIKKTEDDTAMAVFLTGTLEMVKETVANSKYSKECVPRAILSIIKKGSPYWNYVYLVNECTFDATEYVDATMKAAVIQDDTRFLEVLLENEQYCAGLKRSELLYFGLSHTDHWCTIKTLLYTSPLNLTFRDDEEVLTLLQMTIRKNSARILHELLNDTRIISDVVKYVDVLNVCAKGCTEEAPKQRILSYCIYREKLEH